MTGNAAAGAEGAFGSSIGKERVGLYSGNDMRGFSPVTANNIRGQNEPINATSCNIMVRLPKRSSARTPGWRPACFALHPISPTGFALNFIGVRSDGTGTQVRSVLEDADLKPLPF